LTNHDQQKLLRLNFCLSNYSACGVHVRADEHVATSRSSSRRRETDDTARRRKNNNVRHTGAVRNLDAGDRSGLVPHTKHQAPHPPCAAHRAWHHARHPPYTVLSTTDHGPRTTDSLSPRSLRPRAAAFRALPVFPRPARLAARRLRSETVVGRTDPPAPPPRWRRARRDLGVISRTWPNHAGWLGDPFLGVSGRDYSIVAENRQGTVAI